MRNYVRQKKFGVCFRIPGGWWSRGYLPHCDQVGVTHFVTIRLADSLPQAVRNMLQARAQVLSLATNSDPRLSRDYILQVEASLDRGYGACWLRRPEVAQVVIDSFEFLVQVGHEIVRWVIMPNHLHFLIRLGPGLPLSPVVNSFKSFTAKESNKVLGRSGPFWYPEYFDRYIRDSEHLRRTISYIDFNPVRARLVMQPKDWIFGSAGWPKHER